MGQLERLIEVIEKLTEAICVRAQASMQLTEAVKSQEAQEPKKEEPKKEEPKKETVEPEITLEVLRKMLLLKRAEGKGVQVAALVKSYKVNSLDKVPKDKYIEIYEKADAL
jgi:hypothetical protein